MTQPKESQPKAPARGRAIPKTSRQVKEAPNKTIGQTPMGSVTHHSRSASPLNKPSVYDNESIDN